MLEKGAAGVYSDFPLQGRCRRAWSMPSMATPAGDHDQAHVPVFRTTVVARPVIVHIGIGCRKGTTAKDIAYWVNAVLQRANLSPDAIADVSSIDVKQDEAGLLAFAKAQQWPLHFFTADELNAVPGDFTASDFVKQTVGTDNVCDAMVPWNAGDMWHEMTTLATGCRFDYFDELVKIATVNGRKAIGID